MTQQGMHRGIMRRGGRASTALLLAWLAAGCGARPARDGVVVMASGADLESANPIVTVHPLARQVQRHVLFVTLARYDSLLEPEPYFARRWEWSGDRRTLRVTLHDGLRWHDGVPTTARDAAFTLDAARDPASGSPRLGDLASLAGVEAPDDTTLVLRFATAQPDIPGVLCELPLAPAHLLASVPRGRLRAAAFSLRPVGNGPFRFVERVAGQRWVFERDSNFPAALGGPPALRRFVVAVVDEAATKMAGLVSGELDVAGIAPTMALLARRDPTLRVVVYPVQSSVGILFNPRHEALRDARVRRAIALAVRRERIIEAAAGGLGVPATGPVPPGHPLAIDVPDSTYAPARADSLLDAAGWPRERGALRRRKGRPLSLELLTVGSGDNAAEQLVQDDLAARGIVLAIRQLELGAFLAATRTTPRGFDLLYTGVPGDLSLGHLASMYDGTLRGGALDYADFHTRALDALFAAARAAADTAALRQAWHGVQHELARETPAAWIYHAQGIQGVSRRISGLRMDLRGELATIARWSTAPR